MAVEFCCAMKMISRLLLCHSGAVTGSVSVPGNGYCAVEHV